MAAEMLHQSVAKSDKVPRGTKVGMQFVTHTPAPTRLEFLSHVASTEKLSQQSFPKLGHLIYMFTSDRYFHHLLVSLAGRFDIRTEFSA